MPNNIHHCNGFHLSTEEVVSECPRTADSFPNSQKDEKSGAARA
jgi:hypothetical protein